MSELVWTVVALIIAGTVLYDLRKAKKARKLRQEVELNASTLADFRNRYHPNGMPESMQALGRRNFLLYTAARTIGGEYANIVNEELST